MTRCSDDCSLLLTEVSDNLEDIQRAWRPFAEQAAPSFFLSWGWVEAWLQELPEGCTVYFVQKCRNGEQVLAFFVGIRTLTRSKIFTIRQLGLNVSGNSAYDKIWIEYNGILSSREPGMQEIADVLKALPLKWDEVYLPGLDMAAFPGNCLSSPAAPFRYIEDDSAVSPYVDLQKIRQASGDYLSLLSGNTRAQIRRSFRALEAAGPVSLEVPDTLDHAFTVYQELVELHQATWEARGKPGVFSSLFFRRFHERLIRNRFGKGEIQLLRIHAGAETVGCLYSFLWQGRVYFYQCGFNYSFGNKVQPGLASHVMAVQYNAEQGYDLYDFLAGDARYKRSLATDYNAMAWGRIQRPSLKLKLEEIMRDLCQRFMQGGGRDER